MNAEQLREQYRKGRAIKRFALELEVGDKVEAVHPARKPGSRPQPEIETAVILSIEGDNLQVKFNVPYYDGASWRSTYGLHVSSLDAVWGEMGRRPIATFNGLGGGFSYDSFIPKRESDLDGGA